MGKEERKERREDKKSQNVSAVVTRRKALSKMATAAIGAGAVIVVGGVAYYLSSQAPPLPATTLTQTATQTATVTATATLPGTTTAPVGGPAIMAKPPALEETPKPASLNVCTEDLGGYLPWISKTFEEKYGIKVNYTISEYSGIFEKMLADYMSGSATSLFDVTEMGASISFKFAPTGYFEKLDPYFATLPADVQADWMGPGFIKFKDSTYGLCYSPGGVIFFYRTDLFEKAGLAGPPATMEEYFEYAKKLTIDAKGNQVDPKKALPATWGTVEDWDDDNQFFNIMRYVAAAGGKWYDFDSTGKVVKCYFDSPEMIKAIQWMTDMWAARVVYPESLGIRGGSAKYSRMAAGRAAMCTAWDFAYSILSSNDSVAKGKFAMGTCPVFKGYPYKSVCDAGNQGWAMTANGANRYWAWKFLELALSHEGQLAQLATLGISPPLKSILQDPEMQKQHPVFQALLEQFKYPTVFWSTDQDFKIMRLFNSYVHGAVEGDTSVEAACKNLQTEISAAYGLS